MQTYYTTNLDAIQQALVHELAKSIAHHLSLKL